MLDDMMLLYNYSVLPCFKCIFQSYISGFSISWYWYRYHVTLCIGHLHPTTAYRTDLGCAFLLCWVSLCVPFINSLMDYFIMLIVTIIGILWPLFLFWTVRLGFLRQKYPWFCKSAPPWIFPLLVIPLDFWLSMLPSDSFMSCHV